MKREHTHTHTHTLSLKTKRKCHCQPKVIDEITVSYVLVYSKWLLDIKV